MSNDLISRSVLMSRIESMRRQWGNDYDVEQILGDIEDMPTAYHAEVVARKLAEIAEEAYNKYMDCPSDSPLCQVYKTQYQELRKCIDIVKCGGSDEGGSKKKSNRSMTI